MSTLAYIALFVISLSVLVKGADWLLESAEKIGLRAGLSRFVVGALIVGLGTSLPELFAGLAALLDGENSIAMATAIGSNIANILLVVGVSAVVARRLTMTKSLIELDLPILVGSTVIFLLMAWDGGINQSEAAILILTYIVYFLYTIFHWDEDEKKELSEKYLGAIMGKMHVILDRMRNNGSVNQISLSYIDFVKLGAGIIGLAIGSNYLIESVVKLSAIWEVAPALISITAIAIGTSLPELLVSIKAAIRGHSDMAVGNIFGSNIFNILLVVGIPALITNLSIDPHTTIIGLSTMAAATLIFVISGISRRIYVWEGAISLILYFVFIAKLFNIF